MAERIVSRQLAARIFSRLLRIALEQIRSGQLDVEGANIFDVHLGQGTGDGRLEEGVEGVEGSQTVPHQEVANRLKGRQPDLDRVQLDHLDDEEQLPLGGLHPLILTDLFQPQPDLNSVFICGLAMFLLIPGPSVWHPMGFIFQLEAALIPFLLSIVLIAMGPAVVHHPGPVVTGFGLSGCLHASCSQDADQTKMLMMTTLD